VALAAAPQTRHTRRALLALVVLAGVVVAGITAQSAAGSASGYDRASKPYATWGSYARTGLPTAVSSASYDDANELTAWGGQALSYDAAGNPSSDGSNTYSWNARGQLASISGATTASFGYDGFARRQSASFAGTQTSFLYDDQNVVQELQAGTATANLLTGLSTDESYRRTDSAGARDLMTDRLGSTIALANTAGTVQTSYTYEPFGKVTQSGSANSNTFKFTGREQDASGHQEMTRVPSAEAPCP
jgi:hypothetical protein